LDDRFPVEALRELKEDVMPKMGKGYDEIDSMLRAYLSGSYSEPGDIMQKIEECRKTAERMLGLREIVHKDKRYQKYRQTNPERIHYSKPVD
jgi:hypothetical protein